MTTILRLITWLAGGGLVTYGVHLFEPRAAFIVAGLILLFEAYDGWRPANNAAESD